jgi:CheY-like chemotaxis protein
VAGKKVLIVEDETVTALHLRQHLDSLGYQISAVASSGEEAVRLANELNPDLVIMDLKLSGMMDGVEASRRMQGKQPVPVVYLTAYADIFVKDPSSMQEPRICIAKPFSTHALQTTIALALAESNQQINRA